MPLAPRAIGTRLSRVAVLAALLLAPMVSRGQTPGNVCLVLGSDTAIWEGMDTSRYHCPYNIDLYTNQTRNACKVMDPAFRNRFLELTGSR
jgi:hypothetical protein